MVQGNRTLSSSVVRFYHFVQKHPDEGRLDRNMLVKKLNKKFKQPSNKLFVVLLPDLHFIHKTVQYDMISKKINLFFFVRLDYIIQVFVV